MYNSTESSHLITRIALHNDQQAYRELYEHYFSSLYHFALTYLKSGPQSEEAVSDVFIKIWKKRAALLRIKNLRLYLFVSTKNTALNYLRQTQKPEFQADFYRVQLQSVYFDPEQLLITEEMLKRIQLAIKQLPPRCQLIFKLVKEDGLRYKEVAELLQISIKTVENQMSTALARIGEAIRFDIHSTISSAR
ncbi:RNA polymerase sigma-70 factor [Pollutibacter soli]|uniref:RNA polymerase sigma factor n=1 Tax=Pollutibacter soli TaxID=3034157 RepID=UPI003013667F